MTAGVPTAVRDYLIGLRHVGVVTEDAEAMITRLQEIFGIRDGEIIRIPESGVPADTRFAFFSIGGVPYEVIEPVSPAFREVLLKTNLGTNHVCYNVNDLDGAVRAMRAAGVRLGHVTADGIVELPHARMAYFNPADTAGLLLEFVEPRG